MEFNNRLGTAAGIDKNGDYIDSLGALGFGFLEVGTVTPLPQSGNTKPRIFRNYDENSIVNRLGFNNKGVDYLVNNLKKIKKILENVISEEDKKKPLTDEKLSKLLKEKGYPIARRTVAKYREMIGAPVARLRKKL